MNAADKKRLLREMLFARRFEEHQCGGRKCAKYLRGKGPLQLVFSYPAPDRSLASKIEYLLRRLPKNRKEKLIAGEINANELLAVPAD